MARRTLGSDDFNRANQNIPSDDTPWHIEAGIVSIVSNALLPPNAQDSRMTYRSGITWPTDQWAQLTMTLLEDSPAADIGWGVSLRDDGTNYYRIIADFSNDLTVSIHNPTYSVLQTFNNVIDTGDILRVEAVGSNITAYVNDVSVGTVINSSLTSGRAGVAYSGSGGLHDGIADDFFGGDFVTVATETRRYMLRHSRGVGW